MKIGIDVRALNVNGGSKTYAENLLSNLKNKKDFILFGVKKFKSFDCIPTKVKNDSVLRLFYENFILPIQIKKYNIKILHGIKGVVPFFGDFKKVVTVHDVIPLIYPEQFKFKDLFYWKFIFPRYLKRADKIIASSTNTKNDLMRLLNIPKDKIEVILLAPDECFKPMRNKVLLNKIKKKYSIKNKFIFYSGSINPRKNIKRVIESFELIKDKMNYDLIITGGSIWKSEEEMNLIKNNPRIKLLGLIPKEDLIALYNLAEVYVYPSLYEGFGLPILEAQACGCPVITSNVSSMPEVAGKGALLVNPNNTNEIVNATEKILTSKRLRENLIKRGFENIGRFSWKKTVKETLKIYEGVYNEK